MALTLIKLNSLVCFHLFLLTQQQTIAKAYDYVATVYSYELRVPTIKNHVDSHEIHMDILSCEFHIS